MARVSKELRVDRARELINSHPEWVKDRINRELREELGAGLRRQYVGRIKTQELYAKPSRVERRFQTLRKEGFLPTEARLLSQYHISSTAMKQYRAERIAMVRAGERTGRPVREKQLKELYRLEGHYEKGKIKPLGMLRSFLRGEKFLPREEEPEKKPRLSAEQRRIYEKLRDSGFTPFEAARLAGAPSMPAAFDTNPVQQAMDTRMRWIASLRRDGWTMAQIRREIEMQYRRDRKLDPWEFIRREYQPKPKVVDFQMAVGRRRQVGEAKRRTSKLYRRRRPVGV